MKAKNIHIIIFVLVIIIVGYIFYKGVENTQITNDEFQKKQECSQYNDLVNTKIEESGRVFENDTYLVKEIFYSPQMNTCLYAWVIYTTFDPTEIYSIDDVFGGGIFTVGISDSAENLFYEEINKLKN